MKTDKVTAVLDSVVKKLLNSFLTADGATYFHAPCYILGEKPMDFNNCKKNCREGKILWNVPRGILQISVCMKIARKYQCFTYFPQNETMRNAYKMLSIVFVDALRHEATLVF